MVSEILPRSACSRPGRPLTALGRMPGSAAPRSPSSPDRAPQRLTTMVTTTTTTSGARSQPLNTVCSRSRGIERAPPSATDQKVGGSNPSGCALTVKGLPRHRSRPFLTTADPLIVTAVSFRGSRSPFVDGGERAAFRGGPRVGLARAAIMTSTCRTRVMKRSAEPRLRDRWPSAGQVRQGGHRCLGGSRGGVRCRPTYGSGGYRPAGRR